MGKKIETTWKRSEMISERSRETEGKLKSPSQSRGVVSKDRTSLHLMTIFWRKARGPVPGRGSGGGGPGPRDEAVGGSPWAVIYFL